MRDDVSGRGEAVLVEDDAEFGERDAVLLRAVDEAGSVAGAAAELGRSRPWALRRVESLEAAFGPLVERRRGGSGGGGSRLTDAGAALLARYDRLSAALSAAARVPETVLHGTVAAVDGELATVRTAVGDVRALHDGVDVDDDVQIRIGADAVTLHDPADAPSPDATSARNRVAGTIVDVEPGRTVVDVEIEVATDTEETDGDESAANDDRFHALVTATSASRLTLDVGDGITIAWKATATRLVPLS